MSALEGTNLLGLTDNPDVQKDLTQRDLTINEAQRNELNKLRDQYFVLRMRNFGDRFETPESRQRTYDLAKKQETALKDILTPRQLERLRQLDLQSHGARAFHDSNGVESLKLTTDQKLSIRSLKSDTWKKLGEADHGQDKDVSPDTARQNRDNIFKAEMASILKVLTPEQYSQWQALTGEPFQGTLHKPPPWGKGRGKDGPPGRHGGPPPDGPHGPPP